MTQREKTCCFTGHRSLDAAQCAALAPVLADTVRRLADEGVVYFGAGGAVGFDTLAAQAVLQVRRQRPALRLILVLPCPNQPRGWPARDAAVYQHIKAQADKVVYVSPCYLPGCMQRRNRHLVDGSGVCVAYCRKTAGGTAYTVDYAKERGLRVIML